MPCKHIVIYHWCLPGTVQWWNRGVSNHVQINHILYIVVLSGITCCSPFYTFLFLGIAFSVVNTLDNYVIVSSATNAIKRPTSLNSWIFCSSAQIRCNINGCCNAFSQYLKLIHENENWNLECLHICLWSVCVTQF